MLQIALLFKPVLRGESNVANYVTVQTGVMRRELCCKLRYCSNRCYEARAMLQIILLFKPVLRRSAVLQIALLFNRCYEA